MWEEDHLKEMKANCGDRKDCDFECKDGVRYLDFKQTAKQILRDEGKIAFARGFMPRMLIYVPSTALSWGTYELLKSILIS